MISSQKQRLKDKFTLEKLKEKKEDFFNQDPNPTKYFFLSKK
jgi:hypothetical protein